MEHVYRTDPPPSTLSTNDTTTNQVVTTSIASQRMPTTKSQNVTTAQVQPLALTTQSQLRPQVMTTTTQSPINQQVAQLQANQLQASTAMTSQTGQPMAIATAPTTSGAPIRPHAEYLVLLAPNPRQPGVQSQMVRYPSFIPIQRHQMMTTPGATILQRPALIRGVTQSGMGVHSVIPTSQPLGIGVPASMTGPSPVMCQPNLISSSAATSSTAPSSTAPSQMTPGDALAKGTNFFNSLLTKMNMKSKKTTLQNLIQALIDGKKTSEEFASALQKEFNSSPQTQLVPFLDLLLPHLRQSISSGHTKLPGIRPPNLQPQVQTHPQPQPPATLQSDDSMSAQPPFSPNKNSQQANSAPTAKKKKTPLPPGQKSAYAIKKEAREARKREREILAAAQGVKTENVTDEKKEPEQKPEKTVKPKSEKPKRQEKPKKTEKQLESLSAALRDDDDVNDVAAMGGVNLAEESQRIMASGAELVGTQIRSCKDEPFLDTAALSTKISLIVKEYNLSEPSNEVVTLISHATQQRLKDMVERLGILAEHRSENLKMNPNYEISNDIKGQMKFLAELDRIEKRRYEEQERELLLRVAKSRSKVEDPEQQKLRQKAKDMQRAEQEEVRQREANETALLAIGPRKKLKTSTPSSLSSFSQSSVFQDTKINVDSRNDAIRRTKRVNMRDLQVLLELDRIHLNRLIKITSQ